MAVAAFSVKLTGRTLSQADVAGAAWPYFSGTTSLTLSVLMAFPLLTQRGDSFRLDGFVPRAAKCPWGQLGLEYGLGCDHSPSSAMRRGPRDVDPARHPPG
jgi:hypothetical protein